MHIARVEHRLLTDYTLTFNHTVTGGIVMNEPFPGQQLYTVVAHVLDADVVRKYVLKKHRIRSLGDVFRARGNPDAVSYPVEKGQMLYMHEPTTK